MSLVKTARKKRSSRQLEQLGADALDVIVATGGRVREGIKAQVDELPGKVAELDLPGRVVDARRELAARIEPEPAPKRGPRRRIVWIGVFVTALGGAWVVLNRRSEPELPAVAPVAEPPIRQPNPEAAAPKPTPTPTPRPAPKAKTNGSAPSASSAARSAD